MPTYNHECSNEECKHEFEDFYSITKDPPKVCPKCNQETVKRVLSSGGSRGVVELSGEELKAKLKDDAKQLKKDMHKNENTYANMLGEAKYHQLQTQMDRRKKR